MFAVKFKIYIRKHCLQLKKGIPNATQLQNYLYILKFSVSF